MYVYLCVCSCLHTCVYVRVCTRIFSDLYVCLITMPTIPICSRKMHNQRCPVTAELNLSASSRVSSVSELSWQMRKPFRDPNRIHSRQKHRGIRNPNWERNGRLVGWNSSYTTPTVATVRLGRSSLLFGGCLLGLLNLSTHICPRKNAQFSLAIASE